jgi:hypothetical protein
VAVAVAYLCDGDRGEDGSGGGGEVSQRERHRVHHHLQRHDTTGTCENGGGARLWGID